SILPVARKLRDLQSPEVGEAVGAIQLPQLNVDMSAKEQAMPNQETPDRLSWGDSVFLNLEREGMPLNVAGISILEGKIGFQDFVDFVESKLPLIPRYLTRLY